MHPLLLFFLGILLPVVITTILVAPIYIGMFASLYLKYGDQVMALFFHFLTVIDTYGKLYSYWATHSAQLSFEEYSLPILGPPIIGILLTIFLIWRFTSYVMNIFRLST